MTEKPMQFAFVLALALAGATVARGQDPGKTKDAELESLLENLKDREEGANPSSKKEAKPAAPAQAKSRTGEPATTKKSANASGDQARGGQARRGRRRPDQARAQTAGSGNAGAQGSSDRRSAGKTGREQG